MSRRPAPRPALQQRVAEVILDAAARVLVASGEQASMADVAAAAGVARATVYRYFPSREAMLAELADAGLTEAGERLEAARIHEVPLEEGVSRAIRALVDVGDYFVVLARERIRPASERVESRLTRPLRVLIERGQHEGTIRDDVPGSWLTASLVGLVADVLAAAPSLGKEDTIATIKSVFLDGARAPHVGN